MKNKELIEKLNTLPGDEDVRLMVFANGDEFWADVDDVEYHPEENDGIVIYG